MKSYLKIILPIAGLSAASIAVFTFPSCDSPNGKSLAEPQDTPAGLYREYLSEIRKSQELSFEELTVCIGEWQTLKDSVAAAIRQDTARQAHSGTREECRLLHDSICSELSRLALSKPRTYKEVLSLKERFSPYAGDVELHRSAEEIRPFFALFCPACTIPAVQTWPTLPATRRSAVPRCFSLPDAKRLPTRRP